MAVGFSACLFSQYLKNGGSIVTIDRYPIMIEEAKKNIKKMGLENTISILEGDANDILPTLKDKYDFIFIDAGKGQYLQYLQYCVNLLNVDGILVADDVLQGGFVAKDRLEVEKRQRTIHKRLNAFLYEISNSPLLESSIIPVGDGIAFCSKVKEGKFTFKGDYRNE